MKIAICGSLILAGMMGTGFGGYPPVDTGWLRVSLQRAYAQTPTVSDVRARIQDAQLQARTEKDRQILREFEQMLDFADSLKSGELHDRIMRDIGASLDEIETNENVIRIRGQAIDGAKSLSRELRSELRLPQPRAW